MHLFKKLAPLVLLACLSACSGSPPSLSNDAARLIIVRDKDASETADIPAELTLDNKETLLLMPQHYAWIDVAPGGHSIGLSCLWPSEAPYVDDKIKKGVTDNLVVRLHAGDTEYVTVSTPTATAYIACSNNTPLLELDDGLKIGLKVANPDQVSCAQDNQPVDANKIRYPVKSWTTKEISSLEVDPTILQDKQPVRWAPSPLQN